MGREYARQRLQQQATGAILSDSERIALRALIPTAKEEDATHVIAEIEHSIGHYWQMLHDADNADRAKLDKAARLGAEYLRALRDLPPHHLATMAGSDRRWALAATRLPLLLRRRRSFLFEEHQTSPVMMLQHAVERGGVWLRLARRRTLAGEPWGPHAPELWWLLTRLVALWTENLGKTFRPRGTWNRGSLQLLAERVVAIADPEITDAQKIDYVLRAIGDRKKKSERKEASQNSLKQ